LRNDKERGMAELVREVVIKYRMRKITAKERKNGYLNKVSRPEDAVNAVKDLADEGVEKIVCLFLNAKNRILVKQVVSEGTVNRTVLMLREVFRYAISCDASSIIIAHNHPSGDTEPSSEDKEYTKAVVEAGNLLNINVLDHIIVGRDLATGEIKHYSFACLGLI
jgi:DNA repair protein RadC